MIDVKSLLTYFIGLKNKYSYDEELLHFYYTQIDRCNSLLAYGIEYTTFEQWDKP